MTPRDGHVRVLPIHVANKIAAGEVVERPASVVKELVENSIDAGARNIRISATQGGRKLVSVLDDGCGMSRDDAVLSLERQATSKILDVGDIEEIDTLGFRGEAIPSIASVSRFTITTRRRDSDEGVFVAVNAGVLAEVRAAGCPPGTLVEVRDLFCNVPARRKFLRAYATEEAHIRRVFTVHALAHPAIGFSLYLDGRETYNIAPAASLAERVRDLFGSQFVESMLEVSHDGPVAVAGYIERPGLAASTRREQYVFVNSRPASAAAIAYAMKEAYPKRQGDTRPGAVLFVTLDPGLVDVNVHPAKREVRFRDNAAVRNAVETAIRKAIGASPVVPSASFAPPVPAIPAVPATPAIPGKPENPDIPEIPAKPATQETPAIPENPAPAFRPPEPAPVQVEFAVDPASPATRPWRWFRYLAFTESGYVLVETDAGIVTVNPKAALERISYEKLCASGAGTGAVQPLLVPEIVRFAPPEAARIRSSLGELAAMGFAVEEFGRDTFKIDGAPAILGGASCEGVLATVSRDLAEPGSRRGGARWREEAIAKSVAKSCSGAAPALDAAGAEKLVKELAACRVPYVSPRGKPTMIFTSVRELDRKFGRE